MMSKNTLSTCVMRKPAVIALPRVSRFISVPAASRFQRHHIQRQAEDRVAAPHVLKHQKPPAGAQNAVKLPKRASGFRH